MGVLALPLDVAPDRVGEGDAHRLPGCVLFEGPIQVVHRGLLSFPGVVNASTRVDQFPVLIEDIELGSPEGSICLSDLLGFVPEVGPWELVLLHTLHHLGEAVPGDGVDTIGVDPHELDAPRREFFHGLPGHLV